MFHIIANTTHLRTKLCAGTFILGILPAAKSGHDSVLNKAAAIVSATTRLPMAE